MKNKLYLLIAILLLNSGASVVYFIKHLVENNSQYYTYQWVLFSGIANTIVALIILIKFICYAIKEIKSYKNH